MRQAKGNRRHYEEQMKKLQDKIAEEDGIMNSAKKKYDVSSVFLFHTISAHNSLIILY